MIKSGLRTVHPGEILREDYLVPFGTTRNALAKALNVPAPRINDIVRERRGVSADTAMRLARYFGSDERPWLNLQAAYDLRVAEIASARRIEREIAPATARVTLGRGSRIRLAIRRATKSKSQLSQAPPCAFTILMPGRIYHVSERHNGRIEPRTILDRSC
jgi:addiction module HigA family antidote